MKIDSKDKKILIFSDPHQEIDKVDTIIKHEAADINICLGDWFDSFYKDYDSDYKATADYLLNYLDTKNSYTLVITMLNTCLTVMLINVVDTKNVNTML
ncbi:MAG: hypothetical protein ACO3UU_06055 [Minisyncoccia bacterium]